MRVAMTFKQTDGLPHGQNGVGDPSILVDEKTNTIWVVAAWTHGMGNERAWWNSMPGMTPDETAQLMLVKSEDDGKTWSEPINITSQVKDPSWYFLLQARDEASRCKTVPWSSRSSLSTLPVCPTPALCIAKTAGKHGTCIT